MKNKGKFILTFIITLIVIVLLGNILFKTYSLPVTPARLASANMQPAYEKGDVLFIKKTNDYLVNDVVLININSHTIVTRLIKMNADGTYSAKGDANPAQLPAEVSFTEDKIVGEVVSKTSVGLFYSLLYLGNIVLSLLITWGIYSKIKKNK